MINHGRAGRWGLGFGWALVWFACPTEGYSSPPGSLSPAGASRLPALPNAEAWKRLTGASGPAPVLPAWARMLAGPLPRTTARMLELDALHRTGKGLEPKLQGKLRWAAAVANQCPASRAYALADLRRAGLSEADLEELATNQACLPEEERAVLAFARKMMLAAHSVTDEEVKYVRLKFGDKKLVAMVALLAHAAFQDRMLLALEGPAESGDSLSPLPVRIPRKREGKPQRKPRPAREASPALVSAPPSSTKADWLALRKKLEVQQSRPGRIRVPSWEEVKRHLPADHRLAKGSRVLWSLVCYGHQPELTDAWFDCVQEFREEAGQDRIFQNSLFWVVTNALQCFY